MGVTDQGWEAQARKGHTLVGVVGPARAYIYHCTQIGWVPDGPHLVTDRRGEVMDLREVSPAWVKQRAKEDARQAAFETSRGARQDAEGVQYGADM